MKRRPKQPAPRARRHASRRRRASGHAFEALESRYLLAGIAQLSSLFASNGGDGTSGFVVQGAQPGDVSGATVGSAGDFNGDGFDDLFVGAFEASPNDVAYSGESYVVFGKPAGYAAELDLEALDEGDGLAIRGIRQFDGAGFDLAAADINGDGFDDLILSARFADPSESLPDAGEVYVVLGSATPPAGPFELSSLLAANGGDGSAGFVIGGSASNQRLGAAANSAGDVNGDGIEDLILGAPSAAPNQQAEAGESYVLYGRAAGFPANVEVGTLNGSDGFRLTGSFPLGYSGTAVDNAGDVNGDGFDDVVVGAPNATLSEESDYGAGQAYLVFGRAAGGPAGVSLVDLDGSAGFRLNGSGEFSGAGRSASGVGDINGDGIEDFAVGAYLSDAAAPDAGETYVIFGKSTAFGDVDLATIGSPDGFRIVGASNDDVSGQTIDGVGDVNGDGFDDLLIGAPYADPGGRAYAGEAYLVFGSDSLDETLHPATFDGSNGIIFQGVTEDDSAGLDVSGIGDLNGDGFNDFLIGAPYADPQTRELAGESYVVFGRDFSGQVTHQGDEQDNQLVGDSLRNLMIGGQGDDLIDGRGGADVLVGGAGDDQLIIADSAFHRIDGGSGHDTLQLVVSLDLTALPDHQLTQIEEFDSRGSGVQTLTLTAREVLNLSDRSNTLIIRHDVTDVVDIGIGWTDAGMQDIGGEIFHVFTQGAARLELIASPSWQNPLNRLDVNARDGVTPIDALIVINALNTNPGNPQLPLPPAAPPPYFDVSGDGFRTAIDALIVINYLNQGAGGEGEAAWQRICVGVPPSVETPWDRPTDGDADPHDLSLIDFWLRPIV